MKRKITITILVLIAILFSGSLYYFYKKNQEDPVTYKTETAEIRTIVRKTVATGSIVPEEEILIKPNISGIIDEIYVEAGEIVQAGDLIAELEVVPNVQNLVQARNQISAARIALDNEQKIFNRQKELYEKGVISANDFDNAKTAYDQAKLTHESALENYDIIKTGTSSGVGNAANTKIRATIAGMVLEVPVKAGNQVIQANNFNEGTTIAAIADVSEMIFQGKVDESEVGKLKEGLPLEIQVGAIENMHFDAVLDYIAPKGIEENGAVQFEIEGTIQKKDSIFIRAGLSANASIILAKAEEVLSIEEALVQFDNKTKQAFVEVKNAAGFERKDIELGVSDGIYVEVKSGLKKEDEIKIWNPVKPARTMG